MSSPVGHYQRCEITRTGNASRSRRILPSARIEPPSNRHLHEYAACRILHNSAFKCWQDRGYHPSYRDGVMPLCFLTTQCLDFLDGGQHREPGRSSLTAPVFFSTPEDMCPPAHTIGLTGPGLIFSNCWTAFQLDTDKTRELSVRSRW